MNALAIPPPWVGAALAIAEGVLTGVQVGIINQQQPPAYAAGGIAGLNGPELALVGERGPELVVPNSILRQIAHGGSTSNNAVNANVTVNVANGTAANVERGVYDAIRKLSRDAGRGNLLRA
jgi:hypothetical protein